jgi:hypothetical protein
MSRRLLILPVALLALETGCHRASVRRDAIRPLPAEAAARGVAPNRSSLPSPVARTPEPSLPEPTPVPRPAQTDPVPVVVLPGAAPASPPSLLAPPVVPSAASELESDDRKSLRARIQERRDERKERQQPPTLPSPIASPPADSSGTEAAPRSSDALRDLYTRAAERYAQIPNYEARLIRREVVGGKEGPTEEILFQFRQQPFSVYMRNIGPVGRNREVLYVRGQFDNKMHVVIGEGDGSLFAPVGKKMAFDPQSPLVTSKSRHTITDAGIGNSLARFRKMIEAGQAKALGLVERQEYPYPLDGVELTLRPGDDASLPTGGKQVMYFDPNPDSAGYGFPVLIVTTDPTGREVEYYCFDRYRAPAGLTDADFHPDRLGRR